MPLCAPEHIFNFTDSNTLPTSQSAACLACLFNDEGPQPDTVWLLDGEIIGNQFGIAQVNDNGTLVIMRSPGYTGQVLLTCQHGENIFNITLIGELYIALHCGSMFYHLLSQITFDPSIVPTSPGWFEINIITSG